MYSRRAKGKNIYYYINVFSDESSSEPPTERWRKAAPQAERFPGFTLPKPPGPPKVTTWATTQGKDIWFHTNLTIALPSLFEAAATPGGAIMFYNEQTHETTWHPWFRMSS